jgi:uncharacterized protein with PQ loop repeat
MTDNTQIIGYTASICYIVSLFPEIYSVYKTKECKLTIYFLLFQMLTACLFISYDILIDQIPLLISDIVFMIELIFLILFKLCYKKKSKPASCKFITQV